MSSLRSVVTSREVSKPSFLLSLRRPTLERSYLSAWKNRAWKKAFAVSTVGRSPGLSLLYISILAFSVMLEIGSSGFSFLNSFMVLLSPFSILSLRRVSLKKLPIASMSMSLKDDISLLVILSGLSADGCWGAPG